MYWSVKIVESTAIIEKKIARAVSSEINKRYRNKGGGKRLLAHVRHMLHLRLLQSPTVEALSTVGSQLQGELGLLPLGGDKLGSPAGRMEIIVSQILASVKVGFLPVTPVGRKIKGTILVRGVPFGHDDLISLPEAVQENILTDKTREADAKKKKKKARVPDFPWLEWLLTAGEGTIIAGHFFVDPRDKDSEIPTDVVIERSRTGLGFMAEGGNWSMPGEHAGSLGDNFITRAVDHMLQNDMYDILRSLL